MKNESNTLKISELRVGNWYESVKFRVPVRCDLADLENLAAISDGAYDDPPIDEMFAPILLNEEWYKKCGAVQYEYGTDAYELNSSTGKIAWFVHNPKSNLAMIEIPEWIEYVHELQNWYYWYFRKTELEIK